MMAEYGIDDAASDDLPRGEWHVRGPERAKRLRKPKKHPQPVWFDPF